MVRRAQFARGRVNGETDHAVGVLIGHQKKFAGRVDHKIARGHNATLGNLNPFVFAGGRINGENGDTVMAPVGGINKFAGGVDTNLGGRFPGLGAIGLGSDRGNFREGPFFGIKSKGIQCHVHFIEQVAIFAIGMKSKMARPGTGSGIVSGWVIGGDLAFLGIQFVHKKFIQAKVRDNDKPIVR